MDKYILLSDFVSLKKGKKQTESEKSENSIRYIQIDDLRNDNNLKYTNDETFVFANDDDILIAWDGANAGTVGYGLSGAIGSTICAIKINDNYKDKIHSTYLGLFLKSQERFLRDRCEGATIPHLQRDVLLNLKLNLVDLKTQHHIAQTLDQATSLIEKRKAQIAELDKLVKAVFLEMFGDPIANNKKFPTDKVINIVKLQRGFDLPVQDRIKGKYNVWGSNGILSSHSDFSVKAPTIITGRSGTIGNVYYTFDDCWALNTTLFGVETYGNNVIYLSYLMNFFKLERFSSGTGVPTLNRNNVHDQDIIKVPLDLQTLFAQKVCKIEAEKDRLQRSLVEMENNLTALMGRFFG